MYQGIEIINLISATACWLMLRFLFRAGLPPSCRLLYGGFLALLFTYILTVLEGFLWPDFLDFLEHAAFAAAGLLFFLGIRQLAAADEEAGP